MTDEEIKSLITRRRLQVLVHSVIYYRLNESIISDAQWSAWALELENLQKAYPGIAAQCPYAGDFKGFDHSSGFDLPLHDSWAINKAMQLINLRNKYEKEGVDWSSYLASD